MGVFYALLRRAEDAVFRLLYTNIDRTVISISEARGALSDIRKMVKVLDQVRVNLQGYIDSQELLEINPEIGGETNG